jgi:hypothetical protein
MKLQDFDTLAEAQAWETTQGRMISRNEMNGVLAQAGLYVPLKRMADEDANPFQNAMAAFFDATNYNFITGDPTGDAHTAVLDQMIGADIGGLGATLSAVKAQLLAMANVTEKPYLKISKHDFDLAKGAINRTTVTPSGGWLQVTYTKDVERHAPNLWIYYPDIDYLERVGGLGVVDKAGTYTIRAPKNASMLLDDAYSAVA